MLPCSITRQTALQCLQAAEDVAPKDVEQVQDLESQDKQNHAPAKNDWLSVFGDYLAGRIVGLRGAGQRPPQRTAFLQVTLKCQGGSASFDGAHLVDVGLPDDFLSKPHLAIKICHVLSQPVEVNLLTLKSWTAAHLERSSWSNCYCKSVPTCIRLESCRMLTCYGKTGLEAPRATCKFATRCMCELICNISSMLLVSVGVPWPSQLQLLNMQSTTSKSSVEHPDDLEK